MVDINDNLDELELNNSRIKDIFEIINDLILELDESKQNIDVSTNIISKIGTLGYLGHKCISDILA